MTPAPRTDIAYPFGFDSRGRTATASYAAHVRQMIEQLLLTRPGERVNLPTFGAGLDQHVFAPNSPELAAAVELTLQTNIASWLGDIVEVHELSVTADEAALIVRLGYLIRSTGEVISDEITVGTT